MLHVSVFRLTLADSAANNFRSQHIKFEPEINRLEWTDYLKNTFENRKYKNDKKNCSNVRVCVLTWIHKNFLHEKKIINLFLIGARKHVTKTWTQSLTRNSTDLSIISIIIHFFPMQLLCWSELAKLTTAENSVIKTRWINVYVIQLNFFFHVCLCWCKILWNQLKKKLTGKLFERKVNFAEKKQQTENVFASKTCKRN